MKKRFLIKKVLLLDDADNRDFDELLRV